MYREMDNEKKVKTKITNTCNTTSGCAILEAMLTLSHQILTLQNPHQIIEKLHSEINQLMDIPIIAIGLFNKEENKLDYWGADKDTAIKIGNISLDDNSTWAAYCFNNQIEIISNNQSDRKENLRFSNSLYAYSQESRKSFIYFPLTSNKKRIGLITLQCFEENAFNPHDIILIRSIANMLTIAFENAYNYRNLEIQKRIVLEKSKALEEMLNSTEKIVEQRTRDLEEQKQILLIRTNELLNLNKKLEMVSIVAENTNNAIMIMDAVGNILWINEWFYTMYKYRFEDFIKARGKNIRQTSFCPDINTILDQCIIQKMPQVYTAENISAEGESVWTQTTLTPILDDNKNIKYLAAIDSDVTQMINAEKKIRKQSEDIRMSINYASYIQQAIFPPLGNIEKLFPNHFIYYSPRDIVSGDFYWVGNHNGYKFILAADCTGHGVPGALMSMLSLSLVQEIIKQNDIMCPSEYLNILRTKLINSLYQTGKEKELHDGLDIAFCMIDSKNKKLQYAGAYNPLILIRNHTLHEFEANRMPIGIHPFSNKPFTSHDIEIESKDVFYIFTDGFHSQFSAISGKKYGRKQLKSKLLSIAHLDFDIQKKVLDDELRQWKGKNKLTDDILVIGFNI